MHSQQLSLQSAKTYLASVRNPFQEGVLTKAISPSQLLTHGACDAQIVMPALRRQETHSREAIPGTVVTFVVSLLQELRHRV
jgi:hypothetical protein